MTLLDSVPGGSHLFPEVSRALGNLQLKITDLTAAPSTQPLEEINIAIAIDVESHPVVKAAIEKFPKHGDSIIELARLYCDPRLHNCEFDGGDVYYIDPITKQRRQLKQLGETVQSRGGGSQRIVFEGPTEDTVIKLDPLGYANQSNEELGCYLEASPSERKKLVPILGFRRAPVGMKNDSLVLIEERVSPINIGDRKRDVRDLEYDINLLETRPDDYSREEIAGCYGLTTLGELKQLIETCYWGIQYGLHDPNMSNVGQTKDGRFVYHDFGSRGKSAKLTFLFSSYSGIDFEAIRTQRP